MKNIKWGFTEHSSFRQIFIQFHIPKNLQHFLCPSRVEEVYSKIQRQRNKET